jgi:hypothetical protein
MVPVFFFRKTETTVIINGRNGAVVDTDRDMTNMVFINTELCLKLNGQAQILTKLQESPK